MGTWLGEGLGGWIGTHREGCCGGKGLKEGRGLWWDVWRSSVGGEGSAREGSSVEKEGGVQRGGAEKPPVSGAQDQMWSGEPPLLGFKCLF